MATTVFVYQVKVWRISEMLKDFIILVKCNGHVSSTRDESFMKCVQHVAPGVKFDIRTEYECDVVKCGLNQFKAPYMCTWCRHAFTEDGKYITCSMITSDSKLSWRHKEYISESTIWIDMILNQTFPATQLELPMSPIKDIELQDTLEFLTGPTLGSLETDLNTDLVDAKKLADLLLQRGHVLAACRVKITMTEKYCKYLVRHGDPASCAFTSDYCITDWNKVLKTILEHKHENPKVALGLLESLRDLIISTGIWNVDTMCLPKDDNWNPLLDEIKLLKVALMFS